MQGPCRALQRLDAITIGAAGVQENRCVFTMSSCLFFGFRSQAWKRRYRDSGDQAEPVCARPASTSMPTPCRILRYDCSTNPRFGEAFLSFLRNHWRRLAALIGWSSLALVVAATLSPIGARPHIAGFGPNLERLLAYFLAASALRIAHPRHGLAIAAGIVTVAVGLELGQLLETSRHGRALDAAVKIAGGLGGLCAVASAEWLWRVVVTQKSRPEAAL